MKRVKRGAMNRRGQVSFEYILLFSIVLVLFIAIGTIAAAGISKTKIFDKDAQKLADEIKVMAIISSLSQSDYQSEFVLPETVGRKGYQMIIYSTDNLIVIKNEEDAIIGKEFLPILSPGPDIIISGDAINEGTILVFKRTGEGNTLQILVSTEVAS